MTGFDETVPPPETDPDDDATSAVNATDNDMDFDATSAADEDDADEKGPEHDSP